MYIKNLRWDVSVLIRTQASSLVGTLPHGVRAHSDHMWDTVQTTVLS
jgi:hypothetical protein